MKYNEFYEKMKIELNAKYFMLNSKIHFEGNVYND
ncbi:hypothetical protein BCQ_1807 [Bacillus cereus Q1]|uniref:Uncharacterized protein n=1 Tax=Bacillus cereus (strain Q1) TaxID=361100 RepID=B9IX25_BACCQ|nr:hypothetical protein BCQ_1807 [Bacillus cereus Q1]